MSGPVTIHEVGPRDGLQSLPAALDVDARVRLIQALIDCGLRHIEVGSFVSPSAVPQMADTDQVFARLPVLEGGTYSALIPNARGYERARRAGVRSVALVLAASESMNRRNLNMGLAQTLAICSELLQRACADGIEARAYLAVAFACPFEGQIEPHQIHSLTGQLLAAGAHKLILADTIGAANPTSVRRVLECPGDIDVSRLSCHFHDTRGMALANVLAALDGGIREFDGAIGGMGGCPFAPGASGNLATEDLVLMLDAMGFETGIDPFALCDAVELAHALTSAAPGGHSYRWLRRAREQEPRRV